MHHLSTLIKSVDLYGLKVDLEIERKRKFTTIFGGVFSLLLMALCLFLFFSMGSDMIKRINPDVVVSEIYNHDPTRVTIGKDNYFFIFGLQRPNTFEQFYDEGIYNVTFYQEIRDSNGVNKELQNIVTNIPFDRCHIEQLPADLKDWFLQVTAYNVSNLLCIKPGYDNKFHMEGGWDNAYYSSVYVTISECKNTTTVKSCKPQYEIEKALQGSFFTLYSSDYMLDMLNF